MLNGIHFLLTYTCNFECDHCFLYCSPWSKGTFNVGQVTRVLDEARKIGTVEWIFFEGGEPFLFYPLLLESVRRAAERGFQVGIVTNAYGAISEEDAELWLKPLTAAGLSYLAVSNDRYHYGEASETPAMIAYRTAQRLGLDTEPICIEAPNVIQDPNDLDKGQPVVGGGPMFRGRAVEKLADGLPLTRMFHESLGIRFQIAKIDRVEEKQPHFDGFCYLHPIVFEDGAKITAPSWHCADVRKQRCRALHDLHFLQGLIPYVGLSRFTVRMKRS